MATRNSRQFTDFNLLFSKHPLTADIAVKNDEEAIKQSLLNLILTRNYERPFHPEIGCQINSLLFENFGPITRNVMKQTIFDTIQKFEPRVSILALNVYESPDTNDLGVTLEFRIKNTNRAVTLETILTRVR